jgi:hypothetical protein
MPRPRPSVRLSRLLHELEVAGFQCDHLTYRKVWEGAVERRFPAHQVNGMWHFLPDDVPRVGAAYNLRRKENVPTGRAAQGARSNSESGARKVAV